MAGWGLPLPILARESRIPLRTLASGSSASAKHAASKKFFSGVRVRSIRQIAMLMIWCRRAIR